MNHRQRLLEIAEFLRPYQSIWQNEILLLYPTPLRDFKSEWVQDLAAVTDKNKQIKLERHEGAEFLTHPELLAYYQRRQELIQVETAPKRAPMPTDRFTFLFMIPKKQYEIRQLAPHIDHFYRQQNIEQLVDIGGGLGLLAQTLANYYGHQVTSVDLDARMQETGRDRNRKNLRPGRSPVNYVNLKVDAQELRFQELLSANSMTVGLHTCGPLAVDQLRASSQRQVRSVINLGCCYHKIHDDAYQNISRFARENAPLYLSQFALPLASRAHKKMSEEDREFKLKVKKFRYSIHFLLHDEYGIPEFLGLGNSPRKLYDGPFSAYALEQLARAGITPKHTVNELDAYFHQSARQELIDQMVAAGILRDSMGRLLELYLLLDRAIYLEEEGYEVELLACFDEELSSRNIGIFANRSIT